MSVTNFKHAVEAAKVFFCDDSIDPASVRHKTKHRPTVRLRWYVMAYLRAIDPKRYSYPVIANVVGLDHHTTAMHGINKAHETWGEDHFLQEVLFLSSDAKKRRARIDGHRFVKASAADILDAGPQLMARQMKFVSKRGWEAAA